MERGQKSLNHHGSKYASYYSATMFTVVGPRYVTTGRVLEGLSINMSWRYLHIQIYVDTVHKGQEMQTAQMFINMS